MASAAKSGDGVASQRPPRSGDPNGDSYKFCVNWNGMLEPLEVPKVCRRESERASELESVRA